MSASSPRTSPVPIGTVPIYECLEQVNGRAEKLDIERYLDVDSIDIRYYELTVAPDAQLSMLVSELLSLRRGH